MPTVTYCADSTITETWATVLGIPMPIVADHFFQAKETAKRVFFEIAIKSTHNLMGARNASG